MTGLKGLTQLSQEEIAQIRAEILKALKEKTPYETGITKTQNPERNRWFQVDSRNNVTWAWDDQLAKYAAEQVSPEVAEKLRKEASPHTAYHITDLELRTKAVREMKRAELMAHPMRRENAEKEIRRLKWRIGNLTKMIARQEALK